MTQFRSLQVAYHICIKHSKHSPLVIFGKISTTQKQTWTQAQCKAKINFLFLFFFCFTQSALQKCSILSTFHRSKQQFTKMLLCRRTETSFSVRRIWVVSYEKIFISILSGRLAISLQIQRWLGAINDLYHDVYMPNKPNLVLMYMRKLSRVIWHRLWSSFSSPLLILWIMHLLICLACNLPIYIPHKTLLSDDFLLYLSSFQYLS